jgi:predicted ester cyclase
LSPGSGSDAGEPALEAAHGLVRWTNSGRHAGNFLGAPPTNRPYAIAGIDIYRIEDSRLAEHWHVVDQLSMLQQLGLMPAPDGAPA